MCKYSTVHARIKQLRKENVRHYEDIRLRRVAELEELAACADVMSDHRRTKQVPAHELNECLRFPPKNGEWITVYKAASALNLRVSTVLHQIYKGKLSARRFINKDNLKIEMHVLQEEVAKSRKKKK